MTEMNKKNRRRAGLSGANLSSVPLEIEIRNAATRDDLPELPEALRDRFNAEVIGWGNSVLAELRLSIPEMGIDGNELSKSLKLNPHKNRDTINRIGFRFKPEGVYVHKGVGRGYQMQGNSVVRTAKGKPNPQERIPKPWFNPVIAAFIPDLEKIVGNYYSTAVINSVRIYIP